MRRNGKRLRRPAQACGSNGGAGDGLAARYFRVVSGTKVGGLGGLTASFSTLNTR